MSETVLMSKLKNLLQQVNWGKRSVLEKIGIVYLTGLVAFLAVGSVVRIFTPMSCNQARQTLGAKKEKRDRTYEMAGKTSNPALTMLDADKEVREAESQAYDRCP